MARVRGATGVVARAVVVQVERLPRAPVVLGVVPAEERDGLLAAVTDGLSELGIGEGDWVALHFDGDPRTISELEQLNRARDTALPLLRVVLLTADDEAGLREIRRRTVDLTSVVDLGFEVIRIESPGAVAALREGLRRLAHEQSAVIDLTGLIPNETGVARLRVEEVYMPLVELRRDKADVAPIRRLFAVGQPGAGKTTFLRHVAETYAVSGSDPLAVGERLPLLVPLAAFARAREERRADLGLFEFLEAFLRERGVPGAEAVGGLGGELLLLLDGLDEVRGIDARRGVLEEVRRLPVDGGPVVVVSTRTSVFDELTEEQRRGFRLVGCRAPGARDVAAFLGAFFRARATSSPEQQAAEANARIQGDPELRALARTPLLLVFLALLHELEGRIPDRRFLLYHRIAEILLERWERARARAAGPRVGARTAALGDTRRVVGAFAWWMVESGRDEVRTAELHDELVRIESDRGATQGDAQARAEALVALLQRGSALFVSSGAGRWRFVHATLAEYFAGVEMARGGPRWEQVLADVFNPDWQEVVVFGAGELGQRGDVRLDVLGDALLRRHVRGGRYGAGHATLVGSVLREDPGFSPRLIRRLVHRFIELCFEQSYWPRSLPVVAQAFREVARVAMQRSWGEVFVHELSARFARSAPWRANHGQLADGIGAILRDLGIDPAPVVSSLVDSPNERLRLAGWRNRYVLTPERERPAVLDDAIRELPNVHRFDVSLDLSGFFGADEAGVVLDEG